MNLKKEKIYFVLKIIFAILLFLSIISLFSPKKIVKYQCLDGSFKDSNKDCNNVFYLQQNKEITKNNSSVCKAEIKEVVKTVTKKIFVCSDLREVKSIDECKSPEQKLIDSSEYPLVIFINKVYTMASLGYFNIDNLSKDEYYLIVDFSIYNKSYNKSYSFNPSDIFIEDSNGYVYDYSWASPNLHKYFGMIDIDLGDKKSGQLAFVVPKVEKNFTLIIRDFDKTISKKSFSIEQK